MQSKMNGRKFTIAVIAGLLIVLTFLGGVIVVIDPYFHYHAPLKSLQYRLDNERYQNDGILRHFEYDAVITGTSMAQNFSASEFDELFDCKSVKTCYSGGSFKEIDDRLGAAFSDRKPRIVLRCLDYYKLTAHWASMDYSGLPEYLYDDSLLNDVQYVFNKDVLIESLEMLKYTAEGNTTTSFDEYAYWGDKYPYGKEAIFAHFSRSETCADAQEPLGIYADILAENLKRNVIDTVAEHPDVQFYLFFPPYSIVAWDDRYRAGRLGLMLEAEKAAIEMLLQYDNVHLFGFLDCFDITCNLDNYMDTGHYGPEVNSQLLQYMARSEHELTLENYEEYCSTVWDFYMNYDYDSIFN